MSAAIAYPHVVKPPDGPAHLERYPRILVAQIVVDYLNYGWSADQIVRQYPHLSMAEAHAAMLYYWDHREEIDAEIQAEVEQVEYERANTPPSELALRLRAFRK